MNSLISTEEARVFQEIRRLGPRAASGQLLAENDVLIRSAALDNGRQIATARTAIYVGLVRDWAEEQHHRFGYTKPFAVVALGGTGRAEVTPCSDTDFALLFDEALETNSFLLELQRQVLHSDEFRERCGFAGPDLPFILDDVPSLEAKQLNSFLDMRPVYDPQGLADAFRERIRATFNPFEHFLHVRGFWNGQWKRAAAQYERLDPFDIKNDGLRVFLAGIWTLAGRHFLHSHDIYQTLEDPRDLDAYDFLLRIRAFIHSRRKGPKKYSPTGNHPEDLLSFDDFASFGDLLGPEADERGRFEFANGVRARLLSARRRVASFTKGVIERELRNGREAGPGSPLVYGVGGLFHATSRPGLTPHERSRAAMSLLLGSQRHGVPIDLSELQTTLRNAGDWLVLVPELSSLFYETRGSLADSFEFLSQLDGAEDRLFPGYAKFESSLDERVMSEKKSLRGALERQKMRALEGFVLEGRAELARAMTHGPQSGPVRNGNITFEAASLDADQLAAVKLALKTKRLPLTADDQAQRQDERRPLHERFSTGFSEIPLAAYYEPYARECGFSTEVIRLVEFLVANRRAFKRITEAGINNEERVAECLALCQDEHRLRALYVFTCADRVEWESATAIPARWSNIRELYNIVLGRFRPGPDPTWGLSAEGYSTEQQDVLKDFGESLFGGRYLQYAVRFASHLFRLVENPGGAGPKVAILRESEATIVGVAAQDFRGLAASISGALYHEGIEPRQAHLFSAMNYGLALDFFFVDRPPPARITQVIEQAIQHSLYIGEADEARLPQIHGSVSLRDWAPGQLCLRFETTQNTVGLVYALTYRVFRYLRGNIFGLTAHAASGRTYVSIYFSLPKDISREQAEFLLSTHF